MHAKDTLARQSQWKNALISELDSSCFKYQCCALRKKPYHETPSHFRKRIVINTGLVKWLPHQ